MSKNILGVFDGFDIEGIKALVESLESSSFDYMKLECGDTAITIGKNGAGEAHVISNVTQHEPAARSDAPVRIADAAGSQETLSVSEPEGKPAAGEVQEQAGIVIVRSPSYGIFYAQPEPGAPPYVELGGTVNEGDTMCLVEIMKTFNAITAPVSGEIIAVHIQNAETLEPEQPLFSIGCAP